MKPQAFQPGELRDEHDGIIRAGAYGKKTPFCNTENMGILDYLINNLDVLHNGLLANGISFDDNGTPSLSPEVTQAMENIKKATEAAKDVAVAAKEAAGASAQEAADSANSAFEAVNSANNSVRDAANYAAVAATSASNAAGSASTATTKATDAHASATDAANHAADASTSASNAAGAAEEALGLISKAEYGFLQRNTAYKVGDIAYTTQLPAGYYLECVTAGTTGNDEPTFKTGGVTLDGTAEWSVQQSASVASVETQVEPIMSEITKLGEFIMLSPTDETLRPLYSIYKYGRIVVLNFWGDITTNDSWGVFKEIPLPYPAKGYASAVLDTQETINRPVAVAEIGGDTSMSVVALKKFQSGNAFEGWVRGQLVYFTDN